VLVGLTFLTVPGSLSVIERSSIVAPSVRLPAWARPCLIDTPPAHVDGRLAFCARVDGRVVGALSKPHSTERHLLVTGGLHVTVVELPPGARQPGWGTRVVAVGPLQRAGHGLRELLALEFHSS